MSSVKNYAYEIGRGYESALSRIRRRYELDSGKINEEYIAKNRQINLDNVTAKNNASAGFRVGLANAQSELLSKGLSTSGESVGALINSNLAKNIAFATLDAEAERARVANALSRNESLARIMSDRLDAESELEREMLEAERNQYNLDRQFEADRLDAEEDRRRWETENARSVFESDRKFEADQTQQGVENELAERKFEADQTQRGVENDLAERKFEADETQRGVENDLAEREFAAGEAQRIFENGMSVNEYLLAVQKAETDAAGKGSSTGTKSGSTGQTAGHYIPDFSADELVDTMYAVISRRSFKSERARYDYLESEIYKILNDLTLDPSYKAQIRVYASALGYIGRKK